VAPAGVDSGAPVAGRPRLAGDDGVWFFISADITLFGVLFLLFVTERYKAAPLFESSRQQLEPLFGVFNTLVLLTSSWLVALAVQAARGADRPRLRRRLLLAMVVAAAFAVAKAIEYGQKFAAGITLVTNDFFGFYFALTGLHFLHYLVGMGVLAVCFAKAGRDSLDDRYVVWIESSGCYWHMVDLLWIFIFPMLYLLRA